MDFRYRLIDASNGRNLGWFVSKRGDWKPGDWIGRQQGQMIVVAVAEPEDGSDFRAQLIVVCSQTLQADEAEAAAELGR
jgi:hypothetical protein